MRNSLAMLLLATMPALFPKAWADAPGGLVWAANVGGPAYVAADGTPYEAEASVQGGTVGRMHEVKGSQDPDLYRSYREGDIRVDRATRWHLRHHVPFCGALGRTPRQRVFDVIAEGQRVIEDLDVMLFRDGKIESALTDHHGQCRRVGRRTEHRI